MKVSFEYDLDDVVSYIDPVSGKERFGKIVALECRAPGDNWYTVINEGNQKTTSEMNIKEKYRKIL